VNALHVLRSRIEPDIRGPWSMLSSQICTKTWKFLEPHRSGVFTGCNNDKRTRRGNFRGFLVSLADRSQTNMLAMKSRKSEGGRISVTGRPIKDTKSTEVNFALASNASIKFGLVAPPHVADHP